MGNKRLKSVTSSTSRVLKSHWKNREFTIKSFLYMETNENKNTVVQIWETEYYSDTSLPQETKIPKSLMPKGTRERRTKPKIKRKEIQLRTNK